MKPRRSSRKERFFNRFSATRDRPPGFQITVFILVLLVLLLAVAMALLHL